MSSKPSASVSVRDLVEFVLRRGDLGGGSGLTSPARAWAGTRAQQQLQKSRPESYQTEVAVSGTVESPEFVLHIRGRIDGLLHAPDGLLIEEIKTVQPGWDFNPDPLHWAQAKVYAWLYLELEAGRPLSPSEGQRGIDGTHEGAKSSSTASREMVEIQLTYLELGSEDVTVFREKFSRADLRDFFAKLSTDYFDWARRHWQWLQRRDESIRQLAFPFETYRRGQRELAVAAYRALAGAGRLFAEAPTGIGKTIATLFAAIKAQGEGHFVRFFYLTAKTSGRLVAQKECDRLRRAGLRLRTLTLTARDKICFNDGPPCDVKTCPFALGYYDRLRGALEAALERETLSRSAMEEIGRQHQVCPYALSMDVAPWCDAVICDYNYVFDPAVSLRRFFGEEREDCAVLVDEAHNLVERAREMFSAQLEEVAFAALEKAVAKKLPAGARALGEIQRWFNQPDEALSRGGAGQDSSRCSAGVAPAGSSGVSPPGTSLGETPSQLAGEDACATKNSVMRPSRGASPVARNEAPADLAGPLRRFTTEAEAWLMRNREATFRDELLELYFRALAFLRTLELFDERYRTLLDGREHERRVRLFCLDPSFLIGQAAERVKGAVFFSATLTPLEYYREMLGGRAEDSRLRLGSPFPPENFSLLLQARIGTHYKVRRQTVDEICRVIAGVAGAHAGNYLVFFPSYEYLQSVQGRFAELFPHLHTLAQAPGMTDAEREAFLAEFHEEHAESLIGFAVMGGIFGEGIDLVGDRLVGAIVIGVGLPQISFERDLIQAHFQEQRGAGFEFAYTYPGMNRVLQAAGRVIRTASDRGVVLLVDTRFGQRRYQDLFPAWWRPTPVRSEGELKAALAEFWRARE